MKTFTLDELKNGKIFSVTFVKRNGQVSNMNAKLVVKKNSKKTESSSKGNFTVYSMNNQRYYTLNLGSVLRIKCNGVEYYLA